MRGGAAAAASARMRDIRTRTLVKAKGDDLEAGREDGGGARGEEEGVLRFPLREREQGKGGKVMARESGELISWCTSSVTRSRFITQSVR